MFTKGTGVHEIDFNSYKIKQGRVFFLKPGQVHHWKFFTEPEGFIFFHSKEFYEMHYVLHELKTFPFYYSYQNPPLLDISDIDQEVKFKFQNLYKEYTASSPLKELTIVNRMTDIYITLTRQYTVDIDLTDYSHPGYLKILENLENLLEEHYENEKLPKFYAAQLNVTTKHLNRVVKETLDKTTNQLISERVILEAKRLICHSNNSLFSIAEILGFNDYAYFSKYFKTKTGINPIDFQKNYNR
jgi:AraC-like DNA-binding protein